MAEANLPDWISAISQLAFLLIFLMLFLGVNQRFQIYMWSRDIKAKLLVLENMARESETKAVEYMLRHNAKDPKGILSKVKDFFLIEPVSIEPIDIIRRMDHLFTIRRTVFRSEFEKAMPEADEVARSKAETAAEIASALNWIYKIVRHLLLTGEKTKNWILIMQLQLIMPQILKIAEAYKKALNDFIKGAPIGDSAGPIVALRLAGQDNEWREIEDETVATSTVIEGRRVYIVKARGPGSSVGKPGAATERLIEELVARGEKPSLMITVDAALKLEGEETGSVAEGVGAAIGDPGPEKIRFERIAVKHGIPLKAVIIKMGLEEAIQAMSKSIYEGSLKAEERVRQLILEETREGDTVVVIGVGNTIGVGQ
ncbi:MAG: DUF1512 domain-containing protein [Desulfurococcales archaeon]|nr:DUF1512 domain-containing protein [Desulfurococcales archaeon]